ncbi:hypothetical protein D3C80_1529220 [compost metagenome]
MFTVSNPLIRLINSSTARAKPTSTAMVNVVNTVSRNVTSKIIESLVRVFSILAKGFRSLMFQATIIRIGAMLASGMLEA